MALYYHYLSISADARWKKIPERKSGIGKGMKEFKKAVKDEDDKPYEETPKSIPSPNNKRNL